MSKIVCPHCESEDGFYVKERVTGIAEIRYTNTGDYMLDQTDMYQSLKHSGGKTAYCMSCHKSIGKSEKFKSGKMEVG